MTLRSWPLGLGLLGGLCLSCEPSRPVASTAGATAGAAAPAVQSVADTTQPFAPLTALGPAGRSVTIGGQLYRIETGARVDAAHQLLMRDSLAGQPASPAALARLQAVGAGYDAQYTLRLRHPNGRVRFITTLRKADFVPALGAELVTESLPAAPQFCGYLPRFNALAFTVWFQAYDTDWAASALVLLDAETGQVRHLGLNYRAQDEPAANVPTPDGRTLLTRYAVLAAGRPPVELALPSLAVAGTRLVNARTALVAYAPTSDEQGPPLPRANALLLDLVDGRLLARLHLGATATGYQDGRGLNHQYLRQTATHYFLSPDDQSLVLIPRERPAAYRRLRLAALTRFQLPQRPTEVRFGLRFGLGPHPVLYADTLTGNLRCQLPTLTLGMR
ncbi:hypothetical protein GCM10027048_00320 [Hymenobacter coalescens]